MLQKKERRRGWKGKEKSRMSSTLPWTEMDYSGPLLNIQDARIGVEEYIWDWKEQDRNTYLLLWKENIRTRNTFTV